MFPSSPGEAYGIFTRHLQIMRNAFGPESETSTGIAHRLWLAKMHSAIGDTILQAGKLGASIVHDPLKILQAQHPGYHFLIASTNAIKFRDSFKVKSDFYSCLDYTEPSA